MVPKESQEQNIDQEREGIDESDYQEISQIGQASDQDEMQDSGQGEGDGQGTLVINQELEESKQDQASQEDEKRN